MSVPVQLVDRYNRANVPLAGLDRCPRRTEDYEQTWKDIRSPIRIKEDDCDVDEPPRKKTRKKRSKAKKVQQSDIDSEMIDIGDDDEDESAPRDGPQAHQLKFYKGQKKNVIDLALFFIRMFLLNVNAFPDADELIIWSRNAFIAACKSFYGANYLRAYSSKFFVDALTLPNRACRRIQ